MNRRPKLKRKYLKFGQTRDQTHQSPQTCPVPMFLAYDALIASGWSYVNARDLQS